MTPLNSESTRPKVAIADEGLSPCVVGGPKLILQFEGLAIFIASTILAFIIGIDWRLYLVLILAPDLFMLGYLANKKIGAITYNIGHTYVTPLGLHAAAYLIESPMLAQISLVWITHIGFDRFLAYGLKYSKGFKSTHLS